MRWRRNPDWFRVNHDRGNQVADLSQRDPDDVQQENHELWLGVVTAWEFIKGNPRTHRTEVLQYLEDILAAYGTRSEYKKPEFEQGVDTRFVTTLKADTVRERMKIVIPRKRSIQVLVKILEDSPPMTLVQIQQVMEQRFHYPFRRQNRTAEIDSVMRRHDKIFRVAHWTTRPEGGKINYWTLTWMG